MQDILEVIKVMAALAWSDGVLDAAEGEALRKLIERAGLPDDARWQAMNYVEFETKLGEINLDALTEDERRATYRAAEALAMIDDRRDPSEEKVLARLRASLHVRREDVGPIPSAPAPPGPGPTKVRAKARSKKASKKRPVRKKAPRRKVARKAAKTRKAAKARKPAKSKRKVRSKKRR
jgi:uncharacterized tellurite resistance protein B-like protein